MSDNRPQGATNARPLNDTIAQSGPGIPDEAQGPGEEMPRMPSDDEVQRIAKKLGAKIKLDSAS